MVIFLRISAKAPCRVDLAGGTLDIWPLYLFHENPVTINFAVNRFTSCRVRTRPDYRIVLRSRDLNRTEAFESPAHLRAARRFRLPLLAYLVRFFAPPHGIEIESDSEAPAGAGISGSSALMIAVACALNRLTGAGYRMEKIREIVQNVEAQVIRVPTGSQDYYPAMYGGVAAMEYGPSGITRTALTVEPGNLNGRFLLAYTGAPRNSGINNWEVMKRHIDSDASVHRNFDRIAFIANAMRGALERGDWDETARLMREEWSYRRANIAGISTPLVDEIIRAARRSGATAAKACGAGGGGCVVFLVEPDAKAKVAEAIARAGAQVLQARVATRGVAVSSE